jgi:hypothetical protein
LGLVKKPRKPLPRPTKPIARYTPLPKPTKRIKARRSKPRRRAGACRPYLDWLKTQACRVTHLWTGDWGSVFEGNNVHPVRIYVDPAHVRTKRLGGDLNNAISLARHLHEEQHQIGIPAFEAKYGVSMRALAIAQTEEFLTLYPEHRPIVKGAE